MIYLNNSAGTKAYPAIIDTIVDVLKNHWGNPHDSTSFGHDAQMIIDAVTDQVALDINCSPDEVVWTSGACEANSLAIMGLLNNNPHMHFYTTHLEHSSITEITKDLPGNPIGFIPHDNMGFLDLDNLENALGWNFSRNIKTLVSVCFANSEIGVVQDIKRISELVHRYNGILHVDATQAYHWMRIDVQDLGIDMMSISGQKLHTPRGIGFLYVKDGIKLQPLIYGSQQGGRRAGTMPTHLIAAFGKALELIRKCNIEYVRKLRDDLLDELYNIEGVQLNGPYPWDARIPNNISLTINNVSAERLVTMCDLMGVIIGKGSACKSYEPQPSETLLSIGLTEEQALNTIRISLDEFNTEEEINCAAEIIIKLVERIREERDE